jgi:hypothetical protein
MKKNSMLLLLIFFVSPAYGMVYTWKDVGGVTHFTNKESEIPARYRARTKALYPEQGDTSSPQQIVQTTPAAPVAQPAAPARQAKPEVPAKTTQPVIAPVPQKSPEDRAARRARREKERDAEDE